MAILMIASDMDGTLLADDKRLSQRTVEALQSAMALGAKVVLSSGRMMQSMLPHAMRVGVNAPMICCNGAMTYDPLEEKVVDEITIERDLAREVCREAEQYGEYIQAYWGDSYYYEWRTKEAKMYERHCAVIGHAMGEKLSGCIPGPVLKLLFITEPGVAARYVPGLQEKFGDRLSISQSSDYYIEVVHKDANKAVALEKLARSLSIGRDQIMAFGDQQNDLRMLKYAEFGYAMANGGQDVLREIARRAPCNQEDGVAQMVEQAVASGMAVAPEGRDA